MLKTGGTALDKIFNQNKYKNVAKYMNRIRVDWGLYLARMEYHAMVDLKRYHFDLLDLIQVFVNGRGLLMSTCYITIWSFP